MVFDSGSKSLKCAIADEKGKLAALESIIPEVLITEDGLGRHWNHKTYWEELKGLAKKTILKLR